jgi:hypothetical protein
MVKQILQVILKFVFAATLPLRATFSLFRFISDFRVLAFSEDMTAQ